MSSLFLRILTIFLSLLMPSIGFPACFDDLPPIENGSARIHIDEAIRHAAELLQGGKRITLLDKDAAKTKVLSDLKKKINEIEDQTKDMLGHATEIARAINGAMEASDITKESKGKGEEALSRMNEAINHLREALNFAKSAKLASDFNKAIEQTMEGAKYTEKARSLAEEGYSHIKKM